ncbi:MAG: twin-arginine translocase subunit TatC, partial [Lentisphaeria bacterium]|nr:twin-arginine translocase subunit TatC [Lentisphaeria bacterium]
MSRNNSGEGSLLEHLEALRLTVWRCVGAVVLFFVPALYFSSDLLQRITRFSCPPELKLHYFSPFEPLFVQLNLALVAAVIAAGPFILWQIAAFVSPGLYAHEKRILAAFCGFALLLSLCGAALGFFFVIPQVMAFSLAFATEELQPMIGLSSFLKMVVWMILGFALVFELPVALLIPVRAGLLRAESLKKFRYLFVIAIFALAAFLTPPDVVSQLALGIPGWL